MYVVNSRSREKPEWGHLSQYVSGFSYVCSRDWVWYITTIQSFSPIAIGIAREL